MGFIDDIDIGKLKDNILWRDTTLDVLKMCLRDLKAQKADVNFDDDPCTEHVGMNSFLKARYDFIIKNIEEMIQVMENGKWCFSVENTKEREKKEKIKLKKK